jgi:hypothetical protein
MHINFSSYFLGGQIWHPQRSLNGHNTTVTVFWIKPLCEDHSQRNWKSQYQDLWSLCYPQTVTRPVYRFNSVDLLQILLWISSSFAPHHSPASDSNHSRCLRAILFLHAPPSPWPRLIFWSKGVSTSACGWFRLNYWPDWPSRAEILIQGPGFFYLWLVSEFGSCGYCQVNS